MCLALAALSAVAPAGALAQTPAGTAGTAATPTPPAPPQKLDRHLRQEIGRLHEATGLDVPPADSFALGGRTIPAGSTVNGIVAAANGPLEVSGKVNGSVVALHGDVIVHAGGSVSGDAVSVGGHVKLDGGNVFGEMRSLSGLSAGGVAATAVAAPITTWGAMKIVLGWFAVLLIIGIGVMMFAEHNLDGVVAVLERHLARAFWVGLLAELALVPLLLVGVVALAITVIGILLIPFAIVAYIIAAAGLLALGFLAVARFTGRGFFQAHPGDAPRSVSLRALFTGLALYLGVWLAVAALTWMPSLQPVLRAVACAITWVALTAGLGATVLSRAGTQHEQPRDAGLPGPGAPEPLAWQTPTPVAGVAAARRPTATTRDAR
jgi:hypothetical protein